MADFTLELKGFDTASYRIAILMPEVRSRIVEAVRECTEQALSVAQSLVPRVTGELASTLRTRYTPSGLAGYVDAGYGDLPARVSGEKGALARARRRKGLLASHEPGVYAPVVEFGSSRSQAHPFLVPAVESIRLELDERVLRAMSEGIDAAAAKTASSPESAA